MPTVEMDQVIYERLQEIATPFVDTPATVIQRLLDMYDERLASDSSDDAGRGGSNESSAAEVYDFYGAPPLVHVKLVAGSIGGAEPSVRSWDGMVSLAFSLVQKRTKSVSKTKSILDLNAVEGCKSDDGYKFVENLNASYQGVSAQHAAKVISNAARFLQLEAVVDFHWRNKPEAYAPGKFATLRFAPNL